MASRLATRSAQGAARLARPTAPLTARTLTVQQQRQQSNVPQSDPKSRAQSIVDSLPGNTLLSKTAILSSSAGIAIAAISSEVYVLNEESVVMLALLTTFWGVYKYGGPVYKEWADKHIQNITGRLTSARQRQKEFIQEKLKQVQGLGEISNITKDLFAVSKETAQLEGQAYELQQKVNVAAEAKSVLDSWVRYEGQLKARQQEELAKSVIAKIDKDLEDPKVLKQILDQSVKDVERILSQAK